MSFFTQLVPFNGNLYLPLAGGTMSGAIGVNADNALDLGTALLAWRGLYVRTIDSSGGLTIGGASATSLDLGRAAITTRVLGTFRYDNSTGIAVAGIIASPGNYDGFLVVNVGGVNKKVPYFQ